MKNFSQNIIKVGDFLKDNKKPVLYIGGAIIVVSIAYTLVKNVNKGVSNFFNPGANTIKGKFIPQEIDLTKTTITETQAKNFAENLFEAFNYFYGTNKSTINAIFDKIKPEDFKMIYNEFGKRTYSSLNGGSPTDKVYALDTYLGNRDLDLVEWFNKELDLLDYFTLAKVKKTVKAAGFAM